MKLNDHKHDKAPQGIQIANALSPILALSHPGLYISIHINESVFLLYDMAKIVKNRNMGPKSALLLCQIITLCLILRTKTQKWHDKESRFIEKVVNL